MAQLEAIERDLRGDDADVEALLDVLLRGYSRFEGILAGGLPRGKIPMVARFVDADTGRDMSAADLRRIDGGFRTPRWPPHLRVRRPGEAGARLSCGCVRRQLRRVVRHHLVRE